MKISSKKKIVQIFFLAFFLSLYFCNEEGSLTASASYGSSNNEIIDFRTLHGLASWYSRRSPGIKKRTANNERFSDKSMTAAMWGVPFNQKVRVTNIDSGKSVVLRVNDRGPSRYYLRQGRIIDLTRAAFRKISNTKRGVIQVSVELL